MTALASSNSARWLASGIMIASVVAIAVRISATAAAPPNKLPSAHVSRPAPIAARHAPAQTSLPTLVPSVASAPSAAAAPAPLVVKRVLDTGGPIRYGTYFWDDAGVPAGSLIITVDLKAGVLSVFRDGYEIGTTAVIYGDDTKQTPLGTFPILQKDRRHFSNLYHHAPMPYALRLTSDGVFVHASEISADYATHGCVGIPVGFARKLFDEAKVGDRVIITNQGMQANLEKPQKIIG